MSLFSVFLCLFLVIIFMGSSSYMLLLWRHYWIRVGKTSSERKMMHYSQQEQQARLIARIHNDQQKEEEEERTVASPVLPEDQQYAYVGLYENQIVSQLRKAVVDSGKDVGSSDVKNAYAVRYNRSRSSYLRPRDSPESLVCGAASEEDVSIRTFVRGDSFFRRQKLDQFFPAKPLLFDRVFNSCAVVPSSGSLLHSRLGKVIDASDFVIRFNNAPINKGFSRDVGKKTSLRIVNSQVVGKPQFHFLESNFYSQSPVLVWDPSAYNASLSDWYANPDYPFFETFFSKQLMRPEEELHLIHPASLWSIWDWIQRHTKYPLLPNPPSSGFLGIMIAMRHCRTVRVFEYVPSMRLTKRCHYYDAEENLGCTIGDWHPLAAEKLMALAMNVGTKVQVFLQGYLTIPGAPSLDCRSAP